MKPREIREIEATKSWIPQALSRLLAEVAELTKENDRKDAELNKEHERRKENTKIARTIADLGIKLTFNMPDSNLGFDWCKNESYRECKHYISIPELGIVESEEGAEEIVRHIKKNKEVIIGDIRALLGGTSYKDFTQVESENRLKEIIRDQINLTVIGKKSIYPGEKGVEEILLPKSFSIH
jgi:hypothetical protein